MSAVKIALLFVEAINSANIEMLAGLMTEDHAFIDADGSEHSGSQKMRVGWQDYFSIVPDFKIKINDHFERENIVVLIGTAEGTMIKIYNRIHSPNKRFNQAAPDADR
jgi:ketosteroid isomerase-like protein